MSKGAKIWFGVFLVSFLPYLYLAYISIFGMEFSWFFSTAQLYGHEAVYFALFLGSVIPVYPVVLIFQCIYGFVNRKKLTKEQKYITGGVIAILVAATLLGCAGHYVREQITIQVNYKRDRVVIEEYLCENFGEALAADMEIQMPTEITHIYSVKTPLLEYPFSVWMHEKTGEVALCDFEADYIKDAQLNDKMGAYLSKQWRLPAYAQIDVRVGDIDVKGYTEEELPQALLTTCDYQIDGLTLDYDCYVEDNVVREIRQFLLRCEEQGIVRNENNYFKFYVRVNAQNYASILVLPPNENKDTWTLHFDGYSNEKGTTIENKIVELHLNDCNS